MSRIVRDAYRNLRRSLSRARGTREPEAALLPFLVDPERAAVDVGAGIGLYTRALSRQAAHVFSIEPNPDLAAHLARVFRNANVTVVAAAASDNSGTGVLRIPRGHDALATLAPTNPLSGHGRVEAQDVALVCLDELALPPIGFMKIDVEGHELAVLQGAHALITRDRPAILLEAEERHLAGAPSLAWDHLRKLGYSGLFLDDGKLRGIDSFRPSVHQSIAPADAGRLDVGKYRGRYVNNFIFLP